MITDDNIMFVALISIAYILSIPFVYGMLKALLPLKNTFDDTGHLAGSLIWPIVLPIILLFMGMKKFVVVPISSFSERLFTRIKNWKPKASASKKNAKDSNHNLPTAKVHKNG